MAYTTKAKIENYLMIDIDSTFDDQISDWISAAEKYINNYTGVIDGFEAEVSASIKYFDGNGKREICIDECAEVTTVEILEANSGDTEWTLTEGLSQDYITYPYNELPITELRLTDTSSVGAFYKGDKRIKVTAKWGYGTTVPKDIELATTMLVASTVEQGQKGGKIASESLGDYSVTFQKIQENDQTMGVRKVLDKYKIFTL